tara:strand:- start:11246 stop:12805 length:1560 start_codon:yes stop_codon:yes gene_type:complete
MAHRAELVGQMSLAACALGIPHNIQASDKTITEIIKGQRIKFGKSFFDPTAPTVVSSVDTLVRRPKASFLNRTRYFVIDEAHHTLAENKWGRAAAMLPNAVGLGVTATPIRGDGKGLGAHNDGIFTKIILGPSGDELINRGFLSPYQFMCPEVDDLDLSDADRHRNANGEYVGTWLKTQTKSSRKLIGSIVNSYIQHANGKLGLTFCVDIEHAEETAMQYKMAGVSAEVITSNTPFLSRISIMERFRRRELTQLVSVDIFGEGVDVPDVEVISMGRKTGSFGLYSQTVGRGLRPIYAPHMPLDTDEQRRMAIAASYKPSALILDHVGNFQEHLLPTAPKPWSLDVPPKKKRAERTAEEKIKICKNERCVRPYPAYLTACPVCGHEPLPNAPASAPIEVQGDLYHVDMEAIRQLQTTAAKKVDGVYHTPANIPKSAVLRLLRLHNETVKTQKELRDRMADWAGYHKHLGKKLREIQKLFFLTFDVDVLTAQTLNSTDGNALLVRVRYDLGKLEEKMGRIR